MQSVSLPPKMLTWRVPSSTSITCLRDIISQSAPFPSPDTASGRTPQRSAMTSASVSGWGSFRRLLMLARMKRRSSGVTWVTGLSTRVSVVPMHVQGPMGMTKKRRPSSAKKVRTRWCA